MSGRRLLDIIAVSQAAGSVAQKTLSAQLKQIQRLGSSLQQEPSLGIKHSTSKTQGEFIESKQLRSHVNKSSKEPAALTDSTFLAVTNSRLRDSIQDVCQILDEIGQEQRAKDSLPSPIVDPRLPKVGHYGTNTDSESRSTINALPHRDNGTKVKNRFVTTNPTEVSELPDEAYSELFRSPRVASSLGIKLDKPAPQPKLNFEHPSDSRSNPPKSLARSGSISHEDKENAPRAHQNSDKGLERQAHTEQRVLALASEVSASSPNVTNQSEHKHKRYSLRESRVPSTRFGRLWQYGGLATSLALGAAGERLRRTWLGSSDDSRSVFLNDSNLLTLVAKLSRMRGAALKLGQMISFQDLQMLPAPVQDVLQRVQDSADFMPAWQRDKVLAENLGSDWRELFSEFNEIPIAAASIGQVHAAILKSNQMRVAVKIQYPGVGDSISSDLNNLSMLLTASRLLPPGLYLNATIKNARTELAWECDYIREAAAAQRFSKLLADDAAVFTVPKIISLASGPQVLTMELMQGMPVTQILDLNQAQRDWIATNILRLCLRELFEFRYMQTDPNWTNFLFNREHQKLELLDFGASRGFSSHFIDLYLNILIAASHGNRQSVIDLSVRLGYLTGHESRSMQDAHVDSVLTLAEPFADSAPALYDFHGQTITDRVRALIPVMLRERLAPPPEETYSLHRKLSGAFLLCARLGSKVPAKALFMDAVEGWTQATAEK